MNKLRDKKDVLNEVVQFSKKASNIEAVLLTGSMANPNRKTDILLNSNLFVRWLNGRSD
ncbi:MAG: aminoglycoside 6-adenylyltransferase [Bacillota bacterium]